MQAKPGGFTCPIRGSRVSCGKLSSEVSAVDPNIVFHPPHSLFFAPFFLLFAIVGAAVAIIPYWFIFRKAGFSPWLSLLMVIPLVGIVVLYVVAFSQWRVAAAPYGYPPSPPPAPVYPPRT